MVKFLKILLESQLLFLLKSHKSCLDHTDSFVVAIAAHAKFYKKEAEKACCHQSSKTRLKSRAVHGCSGAIYWLMNRCCRHGACVGLGASQCAGWIFTASLAILQLLPSCYKEWMGKTSQLGSSQETQKSLNQPFRQSGFNTQPFRFQSHQ